MFILRTLSPLGRPHRIAAHLQIGLFCSLLAVLLASCQQYGICTGFCRRLRWSGRIRGREPYGQRDGFSRGILEEWRVGEHDVWNH